jgi:DNA-directed RNA polymerase specialized sigma24 family protein
MDGLDLDEQSLVARAAQGDARAFTAFVRVHRGAVYRFALRLTRDPATAEDVLQETFLTALQGLASWRGEGELKGWLLAPPRTCPTGWPRAWRRRCGAGDGLRPGTPGASPR